MFARVFGGRPPAAEAPAIPKRVAGGSVDTLTTLEKLREVCLVLGTGRRACRAATAPRAGAAGRLLPTTSPAVRLAFATRGAGVEADCSLPPASLAPQAQRVLESRQALLKKKISDELARAQDAVRQKDKRGALQARAPSAPSPRRPHPPPRLPDGSA